MLALFRLLEGPQFFVSNTQISLQFSPSSSNNPQDHTAPYPPHEAQAKRIQKHQAIFSLDFDTWAEIVKEFHIEKCFIPHRKEDQEGTGQTWYG